jgi:hypothetical protein
MATTDTARFEVRERPNSEYFPFVVVDTLDGRPYRLTTTRADADREAEFANAMEEEFPA